MKRQTRLSFLLIILGVIFFVVHLINQKSADVHSELLNPVAHITLENIDVMLSEWDAVAGILEACAEMGYCNIELNGARIYLPGMPEKRTDKVGHIIVSQVDVAREGLAAVTHNSQLNLYDFKAVRKWVEQYRTEPVNVIFGHRVKSEVVIQIIKILNKLDMDFYLKNGGTSFETESPTSIKMELNNYTGIRPEV